jgi:hypothetical protein
MRSRNFLQLCNAFAPGDVFMVGDGRDARRGQDLARARSNGLSDRNSTLEQGWQVFDEKSITPGLAELGYLLLDVHGRVVRQYPVEC